MLEFTLLGGLGVAVDGVPAKIAIPRRGIALLSYVLMQGASRLNRERVATILWPDESETDGRAKLRRMLYLIAQGAPVATSSEWLVTDATTVMWNPALPRGLDVERIRAAVASDEPIDTAPIYRGDLLPELEDEWVLPERERLRDAHIGHLERLAKTFVAMKRYAEARAAIFEVLRLEPWREDAMRIAIETRVATGDRAGALAEFDRFQERLREELGVDPMPETIALRATLLASPLATKSTAAKPAVRPLGIDRIFVGRERELATLAERFTEAEAGRGSLVLVGGESGVGKSELVARHARAVAERGGIAIRASATFIETRPYQPFAAALQDALPHLDRNALPPAAV